MSDTTADAAKGSAFDWTKVLLGVIAAVAILIAALVAIRTGAGVQASLGNASFKVLPDDSFSTILTNALEKDDATATALLAGKGFFRPTDAKIIGEIESLDPRDPADADVVVGLRKMLWNLSGPFALPDTMKLADARLISAIEEQTAPPDDPSQGRLRAELIKRSLDRSGIFEVRDFSARLVALAPLSGTLSQTGVHISTCPGSELIGKQALISGSGQRVFAEIEADVRLARECNGAATTIQALLQGKPGVFGVPPEAHGVLTATSDSSSFVLNPVDLAPPLFIKE